MLNLRLPPPRVGGLQVKVFIGRMLRDGSFFFFYLQTKTKVRVVLSPHQSQQDVSAVDIGEKPNMQQDEHVNITEDAYNNVQATLAGRLENDEIDAIVSSARSSSRNAVLFRCVGVEGSANIPHLLTIGAKYNGPVGDTAALNLWLGEGESIIPSGPNATNGVVVCVRDPAADKVLMVKERFGFWAGKWKYPTGTFQLKEFPQRYAERAVRKEFPQECAERALRKELGLKARFVRTFGVVCFKGAEKNDTAFYIACEADSWEPLIVHEAELTDARWFGREELAAASSDVHDLAYAWIYMERSNQALQAGPWGPHKWVFDF
jgi:ADP-ribose pyrophosphatase YjhB (NUDIX family)